MKKNKVIKDLLITSFISFSPVFIFKLIIFNEFDIFAISSYFISGRLIYSIYYSRNKFLKHLGHYSRNQLNDFNFLNKLAIYGSISIFINKKSEDDFYSKY